MRGLTRAELLRTEDGAAYVTKFHTNPLGSRVLASEWIGAHLLQLLNLPAPEVGIINTTRLDGYTDTSDKTCRLQVGSRYPGDPSSDAVYDFLPDPLLSAIADGGLFAGMFVFDIWTANADARQAIFHRTGSGKRDFNTLFIDNSHLFGGPDWTFNDSALAGHYPFRSAYQDVRSIESFLPWVQAIEQIGRADVLNKIIGSVPDEWVPALNYATLEYVAEQLISRTKNLATRVEEAALSWIGTFNLGPSAGFSRM